MKKVLLRNLNKRIDNFLKESNFIINPNEKLANMIKEGLIHKKEELGEYYCPCSIQNNKDTICPCTNIKTTGDCHCQLFVNKETDVFTKKRHIINTTKRGDIL